MNEPGELIDIVFNQIEEDTNADFIQQVNRLAVDAYGLRSDSNVGEGRLDAIEVIIPGAVEQAAVVFSDGTDMLATDTIVHGELQRIQYAGGKLWLSSSEVSRQAIGDRDGIDLATTLMKAVLVARQKIAGPYKNPFEVHDE